MTEKEQFSKILRERSAEHRKAINLMIQNGLYGQALSILRQELDSMVRVIFILDKSVLNVRNHFINQTLNSKKWTFPNSKTIVTDRNMVDFANTLYGWAKSVYKLGCAFIHLSPMSDYRNENPFSQLTQNDANDIKHHLHHYHNFPLTSELTMHTISPYVLNVFTKISDNLEYYIGELENDRIGDF